MSIHEFGTAIQHSCVKHFYHGIGEQLILPSFITNVRIYGPLSTTSSIAVATNFANSEHGLIIDFGQHRAGIVKYFSVSWLSDYANESEYLFIQNQWWLQVNNIIDARLGFEYHPILKALNIMEEITNGAVAVNCDPYMQLLLKKILHHQLSYKLPHYDSFKSLTQYGKRLIDTYCKNKHNIKINYANRHCYEFLADILFCVQWIKMDLINILFPNMTLIQVENIELCPFIFYSTLNYLKVQDNDFSLRRIVIKANTYKSDSLSANEAISRYEKDFISLKYSIRIAKYNESRLIIDKIDLRHEVKQATENDSSSDDALYFNQNEKKYDGDYVQEKQNGNKCKLKFEYWLCNVVNLKQYLSSFEQNEYNDISMIEYFDEDTIKNEIGIKKSVHYKLIMKKINEFKQLQNKFNVVLDNNAQLKQYKQEFEQNGIVTLKDLQTDIQTPQELGKILRIRDQNKINLLWNIVESEQFVQECLEGH
eukprot:58978_1